MYENALIILPFVKHAACWLSIIEVVVAGKSLSLRLSRGRAVNTPVLLSTESASIVLLPHVVVGIEQDEVAGEARLQASNGSGLVSLTRYSGTVRATLAGPSGLGDDSVLATTSLGDSLSTADDIGTSICSSDGRGEETVSVGSSVVGSLAESRVGNKGIPGVDSDDRAVVAGGAEERTGSVDSVDDSGDGGLARVDELVADGDGVKVLPVAVGKCNDLSNSGGDLGDVVDTSKDLHALGNGNRADGVELVAVDAVETDHGVATKVGKVSADLAGGLASAIGIVGRVGDTNTTV